MTRSKTIFAVLAAAPLLLIAVVLRSRFLPDTFVGVVAIEARFVEAAVAPQSPGYGGGLFIETEFKRISSTAVLSNVIERAGLSEAWGKRQADGKPLAFSNTVARLRRALDFRTIPNTSIIELRAYSDKPDEAAMIANSVAESYREFRLAKRAIDASAPFIDVRIIDAASPNPRRVRWPGR